MYSTESFHDQGAHITRDLSSCQNGSDSLILISLAIAENTTGAGVTIVYYIMNHSLITSLPF